MDTINNLWLRVARDETSSTLLDPDTRDAGLEQGDVGLGYGDAGLGYGDAGLGYR